MKKAFINEYTTYEIAQLLREGKFDSAILSFGSCESHGDHLPLGTDTFAPTEITRRAVQKLDKTLALPCVPYGTSIAYNANPMAISIDFNVVTAIAENMFESLLKYGIKHILVFNGHDGNIAPLEIAMRNTKNKYPEAVFAYIPAWWYLIGTKVEPGFFGEWNGLGHAGEGESSLMMAIMPELCMMDKAVRQMPDDSIKLGENANIIWDIAEVSATGATGNPTLATQEKGEKMRDILVNILVETIQDLEKTDWKYDRMKK